MKLIPLTALFLIACGTSAPSKPTASSVEVGSAAEAIRQLGKNDADAVQRCEQLAAKCEGLAGDSGVGAAVCDRISEHCTELAEQLSEARSAFQECLEGVAACEAAAADPSECRDERRACNPAGQDFEARRGGTLACAERTQSCLPRGMRGMRGPDADDADDADAGANSCDGDALDFVGCCHGHGGGGHGPGAPGADAGAVRPLPFGPGAAFGPGSRGPGPGDAPRRGDANDANASDDHNADDENSEGND